MADKSRSVSPTRTRRRFSDEIVIGLILLTGAVAAGALLAETLFYHYGIVYDSSETWHLNVNVPPGASSVDLWSIAAHENGHTLAIEHLSPPNTMQEVIDTQTLYGTTHFRSLEGGDVAAIRSLYGC